MQSGELSGVPGHPGYVTRESIETIWYDFIGQLTLSSVVYVPK
jgi:hypothetical protein